MIISKSSIVRLTIALLILTVSIIQNIKGYNYISNLNVTQGDSALVVIGKYKVLIDGGPGDYVIHDIGKYMNNDRDLDMVILTHPHLDHFSGLLAILDYYHVKKFVMNRVCVKGSQYDLLMKKLFDQNIPIVYTDYVKFNILGDLIMDVQYSEVPKGCATFSNLNNSSVITLMEINYKKYLFMGDAELEEEREFIQKHSSEISNVEYIKLGHHCSKSSTSEELLRITNPKLAVCSFGLGNSYGHPHKETLDKLLKFKIPMYSTSTSDVVVNLER